MSSYYDDEPRRYSNVRTRPRERGEPDYVVEETYIERGQGPGPRGINRGGEPVYRGRDDSVEDIPRDFPPPRGQGARDYRRSSYRSEYDDDRRSRRAKSTGGRRYSDDYDDDRYTDYGTAAAAGAAGYAAGRHRERERKHRRRGDRDYDSEYSDSRSPPPRRKPERRKSGIEEVLGGLGLGGVAGALTGRKDKSRSRSDSRSRVTRRSGRSHSRAASRRGRHSSSSSSRSRSRGGGGKKDTEKKWAQAAQAAIVAGAVEAFRSRKEAGPWTGDKGKRIATAAIGAGGIDGLLDRNPNEKSKRHLAEAVLGGLAANRLANGPVSKSRGRDESLSPDGRRARSSSTRPGGLRARSRSVIDRIRGRSQSRGRPGSDDGEKGGGGAGALKGLAAGGALAAAGKAIYDRVRSKSRKRDGSRSSRSSSADSYVPSRRRRRDKRDSPQSDMGQSARSAPGGGGQSRDLASRDTNYNNNNNNGALVGAGAGAGAGALAAHGDHGDASSDSSSTTDMEKKRKKMRGKELLTAGLATIATIHAAHGVYSSMEAHEQRHRLVAEGEMSPEEARKKQTKAWVQDAAAVGIAALGIKGAFSEWKEMNEQRYELIITQSISFGRTFTDHGSFLPDVKFRALRSGRCSVERSARTARNARRRSAGTRSCRSRSKTLKRRWRCRVVCPCTTCLLAHNRVSTRGSNIKGRQHRKPTRAGIRMLGTVMEEGARRAVHTIVQRRFPARIRHILSRSMARVMRVTILGSGTRRADTMRFIIGGAA